jgi:predicted enzyme related to lactoylglutathione lyase
MKRTEYAPGTPNWVDLGVDDLDAAAAFYGELFGWTCSEPGPVEETGGYRMFLLGDEMVAGLGPKQNPGPPYWTTYVSVADADATVARAKAAGGTVFLEPMDVLDAGRMAVFADPTGAVLSIWQPGAHPGSGLVNEPNTLCWNELSTRDTAAAIAFYGAVFGWTTRTNEGEMPYTEWQLDGQSVGGMMAMPPMVPAEVPPYWLVYFAVDDTEAAVAQVDRLGGSLVAGPMDTPAGRIAVLSDPQGAMFAVITLVSHEAG